MIKIDERIKIIQNKLVEIEKKFTNDKLLIEKLSSQLAAALADNLVEPNQKTKTEIEKLDRDAKKIRSELELSPKIIEALKGKLSSLEEEKNSLLLKEKVAKQAGVGKKMVLISKRFIESLKETQALNGELRGLWDNWTSLKNETAFSELPGRVSRYSEDMLRLLGILVSEYEEGKLRRQSVWNRIKL